MPYKDSEKNKQAKRESYLRNKAQILEREKLRYQANPEPAKERSRRYYRENQDRVKAYRESSEVRERQREAGRRWYQEHKESEQLKRRDNRTQAQREQKARYDHQRYLEDPTLAKSRVRDWEKSNPAKAREADHRKRANRRARYVEDCSEYISILEFDICSYCGGEVDSIDHIDALVANGNHVEHNLTAACRRCNSRKHDDKLLFFLRRVMD
jgi:hypothetical protein